VVFVAVDRDRRRCDFGERLPVFAISIPAWTILQSAAFIDSRPKPRLPFTASGVTFVTLKDETATINVVVWRTTAEKYRRALLGSTLLTVTGHVERAETSAAVPVVHLIAARLADHSSLLGGPVVASHDSR